MDDNKPLGMQLDITPQKSGFADQWPIKLAPILRRLPAYDTTSKTRRAFKFVKLGSFPVALAIFFFFCDSGSFL